MQLLLPLDHPKLYENELIYGQANGDVCDWLARYEEWPLLQMLIVGPEKSGKSTLARILSCTYHVRILNGSAAHLPSPSTLEKQEIIIDDADKAPGEWLFHLINHQYLALKKVTFFSSTPVNQWAFSTNDLASRVRAFYPLMIDEMDEALRISLAHKFFLGRGISVDRAAVDYLLARIDRRYAALFEAVEKLDHFLLNKQKKLTLPQVRDFLSLS